MKGNAPIFVALLAPHELRLGETASSFTSALSGTG